MLRESNNWIEHKDGFLVTGDAQGLNHLVDPDYKPVNLELDDVQKKCVHKVVKDTFLHHEAKAIIKAHVKTKDTRIMWKEICEFCDDSITTSVNGDAVLAWPSSSKFHPINWNEGCGEFITCCGSQRDKFDEICPESALNDNLPVRMLQNVVSGAPNLVHVLNVNRQARQAAGNSAEPTFKERSHNSKPKSMTTQTHAQKAAVAAMLLPVTNLTGPMDVKMTFTTSKDMRTKN